MPKPGYIPKGGRPKVENPGKIFIRLMKYVTQKYMIHSIIVLICIVVSVLANVQGTMFLQELIDDYIAPMLKQSDPNFGPLLQAMIKVGIFYLIGALSTYAYSRIMVNEIGRAHV